MSKKNVYLYIFFSFYVRSNCINNLYKSYNQLHAKQEAKETALCHRIKPSLILDPICPWFWMVKETCNMAGMPMPIGKIHTYGRKPPWVQYKLRVLSWEVKDKLVSINQNINPLISSRSQNRQFFMMTYISCLISDHFRLFTARSSVS